MLRKHILLAFILLTFACNKKQEDKNIYFDSNEFTKLSSDEVKIKLDSISVVLKKNKLDSLKINSLLKVSKAYYENKNILESRKSARLALDISKNYNDSINLATAYFYLGDTFQSLFNDSSYYYYSKAQRIFEIKGVDESVARMQFYKAYLLFYEANYVDCESKLVEALRRTEGKNDIFRYSYLNLMGNCQEKLKNYDLAFKYHNEAIKLTESNNRINLLEFRVASTINICNLYDINEEFDKTISVLSEFNKKENLQQKSKKSYSEVINNIAYAKMKKGDFDGVEKDFLEALDIAVDLKLINETLYRKVNLGEYYLTVGNIKKSEVYLKDALDLSKRIGNYNEYLKSLKFLAKVDLQNKDFYNDEYVRVKDSITTAQLTNREKYARIEYETSKLEEENEKLTQQNLIILFASLFFSTLFILIVLYIKLTSQRKENKLLSDKQKAESEMITLLEESRKNIENTKVKEQNRISKELHDGVLNDLYGIRLNLDFMVSSLDNELSSETETYIKSLLKVEDDIRKISHDLKIEEKFEKSEFKSLINSLVEEKNEIHKINFKCEIDDKIDWSAFTTGEKLNIYRILQEATKNVVKHSDASNCNISFRKINSKLRIIIEDDGVGSNLEGVTDGIGLKNIQERVGELKGEIYFEGNANGGLLIKIFK